MRKNSIAAAFAALGLVGLFSCAKEEWMEEPVAPSGNNAEQTWTVTVDAAKAEADPETKALYMPSESKILFSWSGTDYVDVYDGSDNLRGTLSPQNPGGNSATLTGRLTGNPAVGEQFYLVYPKMPSDEVYAAQKGTIEDISKNRDIALAYVKVTSIDPGTSAVRFSPAIFVSGQSITRFRFGYPDYTTDGITKLTITAYNLNGISVSVIPDSPGYEFLVAIPNQETTMVTYTFLAETQSGKTYQGTKKANLVNGKYYAATVSLQAYDPIEEPLTIEALADGKVRIENPFHRLLFYGFAGVNNSAINSNISNNDPIEIEVKAGDKLLLGAKLTDGNRYWSSPTRQTHIQCDVPYYLYGNIMSLIDFESYKRPDLNPIVQTVEDFAFCHLFWEQSNLYNHPEKTLKLPATSVKKGAYALMFYACDNLTEAPELPATSLLGGPYSGMEYTSWGPYYMMFKSCSRLKKAPSILPATNVPASAYQAMFDSCVALEASPVLPASNPGTHAYRNMFWGCNSLKQITCYATSNLGRDAATHYWVYGVPAGGMFIGEPSASWPLGDHGIPHGWNGYVEPLTLEAIGSGTITIENPQNLSITWGKSESMALATTSSLNPINIPVSAGDKVRLWGNNPVYGDGTGAHNTHIYGSAPYYAYGDIRSLVNDSNYPNVTALEPYAFRELFAGQKFDNEGNPIPNPLRAHPTKELVLGATTLAEGCYMNMFVRTALDRAPALPATALAESCYEGMFGDCTSLVAAPALNATTLAVGCYGGMFAGCTSLVTAPELNATTLAENCYMNMFDGCTSLAKAPALLAPTLVDGCYSYMFRDCPSLSAVTCLGTNPVLSDYSEEPYVEGNVDEWLLRTAASGTLTQRSGVIWPSAAIPGGWSVVSQ